MTSARKEASGADEFELKARLPDDGAALRERLEEDGWELRFRGEMLDRRYDTPAGDLEARDEVLRVRRYRASVGESRAILGWKGPAREASGFKLREEIETAVDDAGVLARLLERLGYRTAMALDREIEVYHREGVSVRIERYPRMDTLAEIEGEPDEVEERLPRLGLPRESWTPWPLTRFVTRFEERTGEPARLSRRGAGREEDGAEER